MAKLNLFESLSKPVLKGLTIAASTVSVVKLLKHDYLVGISAALSWFLLVIASKRILKQEALYFQKNKFALGNKYCFIAIWEKFKITSLLVENIWKTIGELEFF